MQSSLSLVETMTVSSGLTCSGVARRVRGCGSVSGGWKKQGNRCGRGEGESASLHGRTTLPK